MRDKSDDLLVLEKEIAQTAIDDTGIYVCATDFHEHAYTKLREGNGRESIQEFTSRQVKLCWHKAYVSRQLRRSELFKEIQGYQEYKKLLAEICAVPLVFFLCTKAYLSIAVFWLEEKLNLLKTESGFWYCWNSPPPKS